MGETPTRFGMVTERRERGVKSAMEEDYGNPRRSATYQGTRW
jgi:hypothetical protein